MPKTAQISKDQTFNFRIDPELEAAFVAAAAAEDRPVAQLLRDFMRGFVARQARLSYAAQARAQSRLIAERTSDPASDDHASLLELGRAFDDDELAG